MQEAPKKHRMGGMQGAAGARPQELSWLMRTSYMTSGDSGRAKSSQQAAQAAEVDGGAETLDVQLDAIEVC